MQSATYAVPALSTAALYSTAALQPSGKAVPAADAPGDPHVVDQHLAGRHPPRRRGPELHAVPGVVDRRRDQRRGRRSGRRLEGRPGLSVPVAVAPGIGWVDVPALRTFTHER